MRCLSFIVYFLLLGVNLFAQSPHGKNLKIECSECHNTDSWKVRINEIRFDHSKTKFSLIGQHKSVDCKMCHTSLVFTDANNECYSCHKDIHKNSVSKDCSKCHSPETWLVQNVNDIHRQSRFPLVGIHQNIDCQQCHTNFSTLSFDVQGVECYDCHRNDYELTKNPDHVRGNFSKECLECHTTTSLKWRALEISHDFFPLKGGHSIGNCFACHKVGIYSGLSKECYACHKSKFEQSKNPNHSLAGFSTNCTQCHNIDKWKPSAFNHASTNFVLTGKHSAQQCNSCHVTSYKDMSVQCYNCHKINFDASTNPNHVTSNFPTTCEQCHTTNAWIPASFDHSTTKFPLLGSHTKVECKSCHQTGYANTSMECKSCHQNAFDNSKNPNHVLVGISVDCKNCHTSIAWIPSSFSHSSTAFVLTGKHITSSCESCHKSKTTGTSSICYSCHKINYDASTNPNHAAASFQTTCNDCHTTNSWTPATFDHDGRFFPIYSGKHKGIWNICSDCHNISSSYKTFSCTNCHEHNQSEMDKEHASVGGYSYQSNSCFNCHPKGSKEGSFNHSTTRFPLLGSHTKVACQQCHQTGYANTSMECKSCHQSAFDNSKNPNHVLVGISTDCKNCHISTAWIPSSFSHSATAFVLTGKHVSATCESCHKSKTTGTSAVCYSCHKTNYDASTNPNHVTSNFPTTCEQCHTTNAWIPASFDHSTTKFPLLGSHTKVECKSCHQTGYINTSMECKSCHQSAFDNSKNPNHVLVGISTDCKNCHTSTAWIPSSFSHSATAFVLTGKHVTASCESCHKSKTTGTSSVCYSCHKTNYDASTNPNHVTSNFPTTCEQCHTTNGWTPATFDHNQTKFPLLGSHIKVECKSCHQTGYQNTSMECKSCHQSAFDNSKNPNHVLVGISTDCKNCHTSTAWIPSSFSHSATAFVLTGKHVTASCESCHKSKTTGTSSICYNCHKTNYDASINPNHVTSNFPTTCEQCHTTNAWSPATFDHNRTKFPLLGSHTKVECKSCHQNGYTNTPSECYSCHQTDYTQTRNPNHSTSNFPITCQDCHNTTAWTPSTFDHDGRYFPIYSGEHQGEWNTCSDCHNVPTNYKIFACINCHEHNKTDMDKEHKSVSGYSYQSSSCFNCHPKGSEQGSFNHSATKFPLLGSHSNLECNLCHHSGYANTSLECRSCHQSAFDNSKNPNHVLVGISTDCKNCHTSTAWIPSSFSHSTTVFVLTGKHATTTCESCHKSKTTGTSSVCYSCHKTNYDASTNPNHVTSNFPTTCEQCHTTNGWTPATFDHNQTKFSLLGSHTKVECKSCHQTGYSNTSMECRICHQSAFDNSKNPNHVLVGISTDCKNCHTSTAWIPSSFSHSATAFVLTGIHVNATCESCHKSKTTGTSSVCYSCHKTNYDASTNPNHVTSNFPTTCEQCHTTNAWIPASFDHSTTKFPLLGSHTKVECKSCHQTGYANTSMECKSCHQSAFDNSKNPNHVLVGISSDCKNCHTSTAWIPSSFSHSATAFVLTGKHVTASCESCHKSKTTGTSSICYSCHKTNYDASINPNHVTSNFPTTCEQCHTTNAWSPASFNHSLTNFPLTGKHTTVTCISCHQNGYTNTSNECYSCHQTDYTQSKNPNHLTSNFPTTCQDCHNTTAWTPSTFNHDGNYFPIYSGSHRGKWNSCSDCHVVSNYKSFECINCHEHNQTSTNKDHNEVSNYIYQSSACYNCHPKGKS